MSQNLLDAQNSINNILNQYTGYAQHPLAGVKQSMPTYGTGTYGGGPGSTFGPIPTPGIMSGLGNIVTVPHIEYERFKKVDKEYIELLELLNAFISEYMATDRGTEEELNVMSEFEDNLIKFMKRTTNGK